MSIVAVTDSTTVVPGFIRSLLIGDALVYPGEASAEKFNQFDFREEFRLLACIYFLHKALHSPFLREFSKLNYKSSPHDQFRIRVSCSVARGEFVELLSSFPGHQRRPGKHSS
jgi:hypothetical protein